MGETGGQVLHNIAADLKPGDVQSWADALYQERKKDFRKNSMEAQCLPMGPAYSTTPFRESKIIQTPTMIVILYEDLAYRQLYMDGRELEKDPNPTWMGYSVARWDGDTLVVDSSGFNESTWLDVDGHPHTEGLRMTERYQRPDFGHIQVQITLDDPKAYEGSYDVQESGKTVIAEITLEGNTLFWNYDGTGKQRLDPAQLRAS